MKKIILAAVVLALGSGAAMADRGHGGPRQGGVVVHENRGGGYHGGGRAVVHETVVHDRGGYRGGGGWHGNVVVRGNGGYAGRREFHTYGRPRANIWVERPVIREHYYHYGYRPRLIVENYGPREGYLWIHGEWQWNGYEWQWAPGHYEPDQAYVEVY